MPGDVSGYEVEIIEKRGDYGVAEIGDYRVFIPHVDKGDKPQIKIKHIEKRLVVDNKTAYAEVVGESDHKYVDKNYYTIRILEAILYQKMGTYEDGDAEIEYTIKLYNFLENVGKEGDDYTDLQFNNDIGKINNEYKERKFQEYQKEIDEVFDEIQSETIKTQTDLMSLYLVVMMILFFFGMFFIFIIF